MIVDKISKYLSEKNYTLDEAVRYEVEKIAGAVFKRQFMSNDEKDMKGVIRLSSAGKCPRQIAYSYHGFEKAGKEIDSRAKIVFWTGDLVELTVVNLAKLAGCNLISTGLQQLTVKFAVNGATFTGHPDGMLIVPEEKKFLLLEVKSMASYRFTAFERGEIDEGYLAQVNAYMSALALDECIFVGLNKDSGVMHEIRLKRDEKLLEKIRKNLHSVIKSTPEKLPEQAYKPDEKGFLPWQCLYCSYHKHCWPEAEQVLVRNSYKLKLKEKKKNETA